MVGLIVRPQKSGPRWMVLFPILWGVWLPTWCIIPVHVIVYVPNFTELDTTPYACIPLHTIPKLRLHSRISETSEGINHRREMYDLDILIR